MGQRLSLATTRENSFDGVMSNVAWTPQSSQKETQLSPKQSSPKAVWPIAAPLSGAAAGAGGAGASHAAIPACKSASRDDEALAAMPYLRDEVAGISVDTPPLADNALERDLFAAAGDRAPTT